MGDIRDTPTERPGQTGDRFIRRIQLATPATGREEYEALYEPLMSGWLTQGPKVAAFEAAFAARHRVRHALATTSCTTALHLALASMGVGPGDEVVVPAFTWVATANAAVYCGAKPVFVDVLPDTYNIDPEQLANVISASTRVVLPVHLFGLCADIDAIRDALPDRVRLLEDAACAAGAEVKGVPAGGLGDAACFSFHPRKSITTGEGGMLTTDDGDLAVRAAVLRSHGASVAEEDRHRSGQPWVMPEFDDVGFNYRMTDLQAALGIVQLGKLDAFIEERQRWADWYSSELRAFEWLRTPVVPEGYRHAWQAYVLQVTPQARVSRNQLMERLAARGVATRPGTHAVTSLGWYRRHMALDPDRWPVALSLQDSTLALPLHNRMEASDYEYVIDAIADSVRPGSERS